MEIHRFTFNPFQENTYLLTADDGSCIIVDPGMVDRGEKHRLFGFIEEEGLQPISLVNTHCHIDHVLGNHAVHKQYGLKPVYHSKEQQQLDMCIQVSQLYGIPYEKGPSAESHLDSLEPIHIGEEELELRFVPGHAPGHIVVIHHGIGSVIGGDTLFRGSIGRTDLPGGDHETLLVSIREELYSLPDDYTVWPGHGPETTIGFEKESNPFVQA